MDDPTVRPDQDRAPIAEAAIRWWLQMGARAPEETSYAERQQFALWLRQSPLHIAEFLRAARVHNGLGQFKHWDEVPIDLEAFRSAPNVVELPAEERGGRRMASSTKEQSREKKQSPRPLGLWLVAATCAACLVAGALLSLPLIRGELYETSRAERREVVLNDGSTVQLEPETAIRAKLSQTERRIILERGRALFHVAKSTGRPFLVRSADTTVRAVGTAFGVERRYDDATVVTVSEGRVAVADDNAQSDRKPLSPNTPEPKAAAPATRRPIYLDVNEQAVVPRSGSGGRPAVRRVDPHRALAWAEGKLVFDAAPLSDVVQEFNRYNHMELRVDDPKLAQRPVTGVFRANEPETLISFIEAGADVSVNRRSDHMVVFSAVVTH